MNKYTPAPWEYDCGIIPPDGPGRYSDIYVDGGDKVIASVNEFFTTSRQEGEANARLIAAAPELLEASMEVRKIMKAGQHQASASFSPTRFYEALAKLDAAIAKAEGNQS